LLHVLTAPPPVVLVGRVLIGGAPNVFVGARVRVGAGVLVGGAARAVWVWTTTKVSAAEVMIWSRLGVGVSSEALLPHALRISPPSMVTISRALVVLIFSFRIVSVGYLTKSDILPESF
jgi:hypothetical protein